MRAFRSSLAQGVAALKHVNERVDVGAADRVVDALVRCTGRRFTTGVGKSGQAAQRMASSLTSIGLAAHFVHGSEWAHGEMGAVSGGDLILAVSHSGTTDELLWLASQLQTRPDAVALLALTGGPSTPLARRSTLSLACEVPENSEALDLLPTSSTLAAHHVFNALLSECADRVDLTREQILAHHPGGGIGARLRAEALSDRRADGPDAR